MLIKKNSSVETLSNSTIKKNTHVYIISFK